MKKVILLATVLALCGVTGLASAADGEIGVDASVSYVTKYIWRGFDRLDDAAAVQPSVNLDLGNGFYANVWMSYAGTSGRTDPAVPTSGRVNFTEYNYTFGYANSMCEGESWQTDYAVNWMYYDFIDMPSDVIDMQEINATFAWPNIIGNGITPSYTIIRMWTSEGSATYNDASGWIHVVGLEYDFTIDGFTPDNPEQTIKLFADATYNDGTGLNTENLLGVADQIDHDWSHLKYGAAAPMKLGNGTLTPAIYYQTSMEDTVNDEDEFWGGITYALSF
ncbi:hypothetical protein STSP2_03463 [Anaerohalosphaera lusitana]|uniref:Uncharacterized protein n=1 Tax=Anaerohalosphaera lusitana TaxID=1936003 RepID=A0A1U9NR47_9BACT|nr:TorF family putative porin [Anaerohalosphaera lusitana]AQT70257.1 hypothetical protein STSP2_03463 [Anaerohalosphaera lusitana]